MIGEVNDSNRAVFDLIGGTSPEEDAESGDEDSAPRAGAGTAVGLCMPGGVPHGARTAPGRPLVVELPDE